MTTPNPRPAVVLFRDVPLDKRVTVQALRSSWMWYRRQVPKDHAALERAEHPENYCAAAVEWYETPDRYAPCSRRPQMGRALCKLHTRRAGQLYLGGCVLAIIDQLEPMAERSSRRLTPAAQPRTRDIWARRQAGETFKSIGAVFGISTERVRQIYARELRRRFPRYRRAMTEDAG